MKKLKKLTALLAALALAFSFAACSNSDDDDDDDDAPNKNSSASLSQIINSASGNVDLAGASYNEDAEITRACTISNADFGGKTITASVSGVTLSNIKNAVIVAGAGIGEGDLIIADSNITTLTVLGGGANSIHLKGATTVETVSVEKARKKCRP